jgi:hypothetical protein
LASSTSVKENNTPTWSVCELFVHAFAVGPFRQFNPLYDSHEFGINLLPLEVVLTLETFNFFTINNNTAEARNSEVGVTLTPFNIE